MIPETVVDATPVVQANGATVRVQGGQKGPRNTVRAELSEKFDGLWLLVWTNPKRGLLREFESGDSTRTDTAMAALVLDHNLTNEDGDAYPKPLTLEAIDDLPIDLYRMLIDGIGEAIQAGNALPKA